MACSFRSRCAKYEHIGLLCSPEVNVTKKQTHEQWLKSSIVVMCIKDDRSSNENYKRRGLVTIQSARGHYPRRLSGV